MTTSIPLRQSPLRNSPQLNKYKSEWAYLQDLNLKRQEEAFNSEKRQQLEIKNLYKQDLKSSMDHHKQMNNNLQAQERIDMQSSPLPLYEKQITHFHELRKIAMNQISHDCQNFNNKTAEQKKEMHVKYELCQNTNHYFIKKYLEKIRDREDAERRIRDAQNSQVNYQESKRDEKNYIKSELLHSNHTQEEIKRIEQERSQNRNNAYAQMESQELQEQQNKRQMNRDQNIQKYHIKTHSHPVISVFLENHLKSLEDKRHLDKVLIDDYNSKKQREDQERQMQDKDIRRQVKNNILSTLDAQIALKQEMQNIGMQEKKRYNDFLQEKDKEVHEQQYIRRVQQNQFRKDYTNELRDQILQRGSSKNDFMDERELVLNRKIFENGGSSAVPGMIQDHRRKKQLDMISKSYGYQSLLASPEKIQLYNSHRGQQPAAIEESPRKTDTINSYGSQKQIIFGNRQQNHDQLNGDQTSPQPQRSKEMINYKQGNNILLQTGKNLFG